MKLKGIFTALLAAALVCLLPVTALADAETQPALLLSAVSRSMALWEAGIT